ncbi:MAG: hypothetical protein WKF73_03075 [Nocardioidaceae bacterium]
MTDHTISVRLLAADDEADESELGGVRDRFMIDGADTDGRFALVEHRFAPKALAAPMHRHRHEDEYTYVLRGRIGAVIEGPARGDLGRRAVVPAVRPGVPRCRGVVGRARR